MGRAEKILEKIKSGHADANFSFEELLLAARSLGLPERSGNHPHIFQGTVNGHPLFLNLQPSSGGKAKPYQVKQVRKALADLEMQTKKEAKTS